MWLLMCVVVLRSMPVTCAAIAVIIVCVMTMGMSTGVRMTIKFAWTGHDWA